MTRQVHPLAFWLSFALGLILLLIGLLLLSAPEQGERLFGIAAFSEGGDYRLHLAVGIREAYIGLLIMLLTMFRQFRGLGIILLSALVIPVADFLIATSDGGMATAALTHLSSVPLVLILSIYFLRNEIKTWSR